MSLHRAKLLTAGVLLLLIVAATLAYGVDYYGLSAGDRVVSGKHRELRPSGSIGLRLGMLGAVLFVCLYAYPIRKRWKWLQRFGKTKNWLDFHILFGISVPLIVTLHSSFKFQGIAGVAYWLMIAVAASGFVGRYIYAQIPKSINETTLTLDELEKLSSSALDDLSNQRVFSPGQLQRFLRTPDASRVEQMSVIGALLAMAWRDLTRPLQTAGLRRSVAESAGANIRTLFGFLPSPNAELEDAIRLVRRQSRLAAKMAFLGKANQIFQLWHVVHRPFSYSFAVLAGMHVGLAMLMGYF